MLEDKKENLGYGDYYERYQWPSWTIYFNKLDYNVKS